MTALQVSGIEVHGGSLLPRISNDFATMQKECWGLDPVQAKSYMMDDLLLIIMRGGMTQAERTMLDFGCEDLVRGFRQSFENEMTQRVTAMIEQLTGRKVLTYQSLILFAPDMVAELFLFENSADQESAEIVATAKGQLHERPNGAIDGDTDGGTGTQTAAAPTGEAPCTNEGRPAVRPHVLTGLRPRSAFDPVSLDARPPVREARCPASTVTGGGRIWRRLSAGAQPVRSLSGGFRCSE